MKKGFTLIELLLVVTILGILAAISLPKFFPQTERARVAEAVAILQSIRQGEAAYFLEHNTYCDPDGGACTWNDLGMEDPNLNPSNFFDYTVNIVQLNIIRAERKPGVKDPGDKYGDSYISLSLSGGGGYGGDHPLRPQ